MFKGAAREDGRGAPALRGRECLKGLTNRARSPARRQPGAEINSAEGRALANGCMAGLPSARCITAAGCCRCSTPHYREETASRRGRGEPSATYLSRRLFLLLSGRCTWKTSSSALPPSSSSSSRRRGRLCRSAPSSSSRPTRRASRRRCAPGPHPRPFAVYLRGPNGPMHGAGRRTRGATGGRFVNKAAVVGTICMRRAAMTAALYRSLAWSRVTRICIPLKNEIGRACTCQLSCTGPPGHMAYKTISPAE